MQDWFYEVGGTLIMSGLFVFIGLILMAVERYREERIDNRRWSRSGRMVR